MATDDLKDEGLLNENIANQEEILPIPEVLPVLPVQDAVTSSTDPMG